MREIHAAERYRIESHREGLNSESRTGQPPLDEHIQSEQEQAALRQEGLKELCKKGSNKRSVLSDLSISPVSHLPAHQDKKNIEGDPDLMGREGNIAADIKANTARSFRCPPDTFMPVGSARFVATVCGRMITGEIGNFIRRLGQAHAVGMSIQDVKQLRRLVANATANFEEGQDGEDPPQASNQRRSERIPSMPKHDYSELITEPNEEEEGSVEITVNQIDEEEPTTSMAISKPTTQGVLMKALIAFPAYKFNPNKSMTTVLLATHRMLSHTRMVRGDPKLREILVERGISSPDSKKNQLEPSWADDIDLCPLCCDDPAGCAYGNQEHYIQFCPVLEELRCEMYARVERIMIGAEAHLTNRAWDLQYPGKAEFSALRKYADRFPRLSKMAWLLPVLTLSNKRLASTIANTWLLSHKTAVDNRILLLLLEKWNGPKDEAFKVMDNINEAVRDGTIKIAQRAQAELGKFYSKVRKELKEPEEPVDKETRSEQHPTIDPAKTKESHIAKEQSTQEVSKNAKKRQKKDHTKCEAPMCLQIRQNTGQQPFPKAPMKSMCSRCHKFEEAEKVIIKICSELCKQHDICMEIDQTAK